MTQEEKQLLLIDLCERLPYGVIVHSVDINHEESEADTKVSPTDSWIFFNRVIAKPYLRPLSSMTKEERAERVAILWELEGHIDEDVTYKYQDWLLSHHFDFRNLIEKGLALEAPKGMYEFL